MADENIENEKAEEINEEVNETAEIVEENSEETVEEPVDELAQAKQQAADNLASWQRVTADFANYKKIKEQERLDFIKYSEESFVKKLLPILDDFERAIDASPENEKSQAWFTGFVGIYKKFQSLLEMSNVTPIDAVGLDFDPNLHNAVMQVPGEDGKVMQVYQKGYKLFDRVIRPASVTVGNGEPVPEENK